jgi:acyl dehydratase
VTDVAQQFDDATAALLTDEDIERDRLLVGLDLASNAQEYLSEATPEGIRNFAASYGDDNPLYAEPGYGAGTRWGTQIAPPFMAGILNRPLLGDKLDPEIKRRTKGTYRGIHSFVSGGTWDWFRPIRPGDIVYSYEGVESVEVRPSEFAGRSVLRVRRRVKFNQRGEVLGVYRILNILTERKTARSKGKYAAIEPAAYDQAALERIDAIYAAERPRGPQPRYWEDVQIGDELGEMVKGPLTVTDMVVFHAGGYGFYPYGLKTGRLGYRNRLRIPAFYVPNEHGVPDVAQRVHWDSAWAQAIGNPMAYDYGVLRECWIQHYLTDWIGDDGFLVHQHDEVRRFNYVGDATFLQGRVVGKREEGGRFLVDLKVETVNQRGEQTAHAAATALLPSREAGPVVLPEAPHELTRRAAEMLMRHAELAHGAPATAG